MNSGLTLECSQGPVLRRWWAFLGAFVLILYGSVPTMQPTADFGRIFAVYGGFFIVYSYGWGWALDKAMPDTGL